MKIPPDSLITDDKLTQYLLILRPKDDKSKFLAQAGFTLENAVSLRKSILNLIILADAIEDGSNEYGIFYRVEGILEGVNGNNLAVVTIWIRRSIDNCFHFVTLKPPKGYLIMNVKLYDNVVLCRDFPENNLKLGDVAVLVDFIPHPSGKETGAILEIFNAIGESIGVVAVPISAIKPLQSNEIFTVRSLLKTQ